MVTQVGKMSMEWLAGEKTKVTGTFPPRNRGWTGYVEKDTAGQTNIYSIEVSSFKIFNHQGFLASLYIYYIRTKCSRGNFPII